MQIERDNEERERECVWEKDSNEERKGYMNVRDRHRERVCVWEREREREREREKERYIYYI